MVAPTQDRRRLLRPCKRFARRRKGIEVEDRETGARASEAGAPEAYVGPVGPAGRGDHARPGHPHAPNPAPKGKKRRKRRRGRKVFARDAQGNALRQPVANEPQPAASRPPAEREPAPSAAVATPPTSRERTAPRPGDLPVFAALDLGTNNCRLLVAVPARPGQFRVIDAFSRIVRLGEGLAASGRLADAAMDRAVDALRVCADKLGNRHVERARLIATEACRAAANGEVFLERVRAETGLVLEIIDRETEARLAVSGCGSLVERDTDAVVLFDIGGGSSEIALIDLTGQQRSPRLANHIVAWTSLPVGVVSLAERFGGREVTQQSFDAMVAHVGAMIDGFAGRGRVDHLREGRFHLLGTSGTVTTLAGVHLGLERYDRRRVDGLWMDNDSIDAMIATLLGWDFQRRVANACIGADRADLVLAGCAILEAIRKAWPSKRLRVADRGLREGMLSELMGEAGVWRRDWRHDRHPSGARP